MKGTFKDDPNFHENDFDVSELADSVGTLVNCSPLASESTATTLIGAVPQRWSEHHAGRGVNFFQLKSYLFKEFPCLDTPDLEKVVWDCGCGVGSALFPIARRCPRFRCFGSDISPEAVQLMEKTDHFDASRMSAFVWDVSTPPCLPAGGSAEGVAGSSCGASRPRPAPGTVDFLLLVFLISSLTHAQLQLALFHVRPFLAPGARILVRDYGFLDERQVKFEQQAVRIACSTYVRNDGTLARFFSTEELVDEFRHAGYGPLEVGYKTVRQRNRKQDRDLHRVYIHGVFAVEEAVPSTLP